VQQIVPTSLLSHCFGAASYPSIRLFPHSTMIRNIMLVAAAAILTLLASAILVVKRQSDELQLHTTEFERVSFTMASGLPLPREGWLT
jgi:hypothetical protein